MTAIFPQTLMTPDQVAAYLGVSVETLNVWRCTKRYNLPYIKAGRLVRYRREDVDAFITDRMQGGQ
ncbi:helix-turn-helix domain-containing protein [Paracoccus saliphilus]|uniref:DNA binding domain-containing protein, excisionase family n=1 Tax=Paracoccus saliphilus TaxID=405559 RepID=A0AA45W7G0_9RHOB|nr:helix-turn-helix domain-containing protein [Paracoccus saliphilus]WCR02752.1 helix-turn-helix domain-containing protein [Paracoccus saliphilus]SIT08820.1 DNA binding domain-containing protein, excisionase family [Paracoccus saliphilus]